MEAQDGELPLLDDRFSTNEKVDFKKISKLPPSAECKKKNFIGDQVIAERIDESDEDEDDEGNEAKEGAATTKQASVGYRMKFGRIAELANESTKEYNKAKKETGIKRQSDIILNKAKQD